MFVFGIIVGVIIASVAGVLVLAWVADRFYWLGRRDQRKLTHETH